MGSNLWLLLFLILKLIAALFIISSRIWTRTQKKKTDKKKIEEEQQNNINDGSWNGVSRDLMDLILQQLDPSLKHLIRISTVCKSWRSLLMRKDLLLKASLNETPWLLLPQNSNCSKELSFYDIAEGVIHNFKNALGGWCCGSSRGWLVLAKSKSTFMPKTQIFIWNPITSAKYQLPCFETADFYESLDKLPNVSYFMDKFIFLSDEEKDNSHCIVAAIFDSGNVLAFCKPGGETWTKFPNMNTLYDEDYYGDILFFNQMLYVLSYNEALPETKTETHTFKLEDSETEVRLRLIRSSTKYLGTLDTESYQTFCIDKALHRDKYLAKSTRGDQLFLINRISDVFVDRTVAEEEENNYEDIKTILNYYRTRRFEVYRLSGHNDDDDSGLHMTRLESFGDDQVLFLTLSGSTFLKASTDLIGKNCIYFAEDRYQNPIDHYPLVSRDSGVFYLDKERIVRTFPSVKLPMQSRICWFTPSPCSC